MQQRKERVIIMCRQEWIDKAEGKMNKQMLQADLPLLDKAQLYALETSIERAPFPTNEKPKAAMITKLPKMLPAMTTYSKSIKMVKKTSLVKGDKSIDQNTFDQMIKVLKDCQIENIGYVEIDGSDVFKHLGVPYKYMLIFTAHQEVEPILTSPSIESQAEVAMIYGRTGNASNKVSQYLEDQGFGAMPSHSLGGSVDYTKLAQRAGIGEFGRHGLLIEPISGPNHRIGGVFTNIDNLGDFLNQTNEHEWIKDFCAKCGKCIRKCPVKAINENPTVNENGYTTCIDPLKCGHYFGENFGCNICVASCPFTRVGYNKLKDKFVNKE